MSSLLYKFEIPDPSQPIPEDQRGMVGPSAHLMPFVPKILTEAEVIGRRIDTVLTHLGTYGMGGPGFFGLKLDEDWLVIAIWGAGEWIEIDGTLVQDHFFDISARPEPWINGGDDRLSPRLVGTEITSLQVHRHSMQMGLGNGMKLSISESHEDRPILQGSKEARRFLDEDDLRKVVFLSPTAEIWV